MKELREKAIELLRRKFGDAVYDDLCDKRSVEEVADYFLENHSVDEIERDGLNVCLGSWTEEFVPAKEMEAMYNANQIEMLQENACAWNEGRPPIYSEEEIWEEA